MKSYSSPYRISRFYLEPLKQVATLIAILCFGALFCHESRGQGKGAIVRELVELLSRKFGKEVAEEGSEILSKKVESFVVRFGDDGVEALQKVGPRAIGLIDDAAADSALAARLLAKYGDDAAWVVGNPARRSLVSKVGDDAAEAMMKHREIAEPLIEAAGKPAATAMRAISEQNGIRLAIMGKQGELASLPQSSRVLDLIGQLGDKAMDFVWKNKGVLAAGTVMAAFLADPEPFLDGTKKLAELAATNAVAPIAEEIGKRTNWTFTLISFAVCVLAYVLIKQVVRKLGRKAN
jgi:hypothetical protein